MPEGLKMVLVIPKSSLQALLSEMIHSQGNGFLFKKHYTSQLLTPSS